MTGAKVDKPVANAWVSLSDLDNGDTAVWTGQADGNGMFDITNVPDGSYTITWWDEPQDYILGVQNVTVTGGEVVDLGTASAQRLVDDLQRLRVQRHEPQRQDGLDRHERRRLPGGR